MGGGEEKLNVIFTYKEGDEATYFVSEGLGDQELDVRPSGGVATASKKGEVDWTPILHISYHIFTLILYKILLIMVFLWFLGPL